ncbi:Uncharacterised protein [Burkholderia pseudomallei]|nr:Uncharacterised protein [Burkholderia pseudomallei]CAJ3433666.1 Uncharacterised protein [Burkholderia pseudomallei]CAJ4223917.1 Uncharacterised protein [Burkholderia pseudomallei]CAJ4607536.1 Uncharacterised protein [Burkholderia pseudomallei]CAJ4615867.1 Uncharacterised protein [Burkholderia pseudomallei]
MAPAGVSRVGRKSGLRLAHRRSRRQRARRLAAIPLVESSAWRALTREATRRPSARPPVDPGNPSNPSNPSLDIRRTPLFAPLPMSIDALASRSDGLQRKPDTSIDAARTLRRRVRTDHPLRAVHRVPRSNRSVSAAHCRRNGVRMAAEPIKIDPSAYGPGAARDRPCDTLVAERGARTFAAPHRHRRAAAPMPARPPPASVFQRARRPHIIRASRIRRATGARRLRRMDRRARPRGAAHRNPR